MGGSTQRARARVAERLRERRGEIEQATLTRVYALSDQNADSEYAHGLRAAVAAALGHGLDALETSEDRSPPIPAVLFTQARLAARGGISLDTVLRRYFAGYTLLGDFVIQEAEENGLLEGPGLQRLLRGQAALFDRLLAAVSEEYSREQRGQVGSAEQRRADRVRRLLDGEPLDASELAYELDGWHLGAIAAGLGAAQMLVELAKGLDYRLLSVRREEEGTVWAWLGSGRGIDPEAVEKLFARNLPAGVSLALGEPGKGVAGWRLTHRQARAALPIALRGNGNLARYANVALVASMLRDGLLTTSLHTLYLAPLYRDCDDGEVLQETLRAYLAAERNVSSTAAALGVNRHTVTKRLRIVEERLGRSLNSCTTELDAALRLEASGFSIHTGAHWHS